MSQQWKWLSNFCFCTMWQEWDTGPAQTWWSSLGQKGGHPAGLVHREMPALWSGGQRGPQTSAPARSKELLPWECGFPSAWGLKGVMDTQVASQE